MSARVVVLFAAVLGVLLVPEVCWAGPPLNVSVTLEGPDEGFADEGLDYTATGGFDLDGETQAEVTNGEATVEEEYAWSYAPASCDTAPATGPEETFRFAEQHAPGEYTITVTYTVTVRYKDGTSDDDWDSDSIQVQVLAGEVRFLPSHDFIVPGSSLNTIRYEITIEEAGQVQAQIEVRNREDAVVRTLSVPAGKGTHSYQWNGHDGSDEPLTAAESPYTYHLSLTVDGQGDDAWTDELGGRQVVEWRVYIAVTDPLVDGYASGIDVTTITTGLVTVTPGLDGGPGGAIARYDVVEEGKGARIWLMDEEGYHLFYTSPTPADDVPEIWYHLRMTVGEGGILDRARNEFDCDEEREGRQSFIEWKMRFTGDGELVVAETTTQ